MSFIREILADEANRLDDEFIDRLDTLAAWSGQTRNLIRRIPECVHWLHAKYANPLSLYHSMNAGKQNSEVILMI